MKQGVRTGLAEPKVGAMSMETRKMPLPMVSPITMAVADQRPRPRIRSARSGCAVRLGLDALTKVDRAYYPEFRWSINFAYELERSEGFYVFCGPSRSYALSSRRYGYAKIHAE